MKRCATAPALSTPQRMRILVVQDTRECCEHICRLLAFLGLDAEMTADLGEAILAVSESRADDRLFDLIFLEFSASSNSQAAATEELLRSLPTNRRSRVIATCQDPKASHLLAHTLHTLQPLELGDLTSPPPKTSFMDQVSDLLMLPVMIPELEAAVRKMFPGWSPLMPSDCRNRDLRLRLPELDTSSDVFASVFDQPGGRVSESPDCSPVHSSPAHSSPLQSSPPELSPPLSSSPRPDHGRDRGRSPSAERRTRKSKSLTSSGYSSMDTLMQTVELLDNLGSNQSTPRSRVMKSSSVSSSVRARGKKMRRASLKVQVAATDDIPYVGKDTGRLWSATLWVGLTAWTAVAAVTLIRSR